MAILVVGWDPEWAEEFADLLRARVPGTQVLTIHHSIGDEPQQLKTLYAQCEYESETRTVRKRVHTTSLTQLIAKKFEEGIACDLAVINTDFGFESAACGIRRIRGLPRYKDTPVIVVDGSSRRDLNEAIAEDIAKVITSYDVDAVVPFLEVE